MVRCLVPGLPALAACLALVQLPRPCSADFAVVGPPEPVLAMVGEVAHLPCHLSPKRSAETLQLMWVRPSPRQVVHTYAHGQEDTPAEEYRGRTSILREDVGAGEAALQIRDVRASDNGTYLCYFQDVAFYAKAQVELRVAALGPDIHVEMKGYEAAGIRVNCTSAGWYPRPQIQWRDAGGQSLLAKPASEAVDAQGLYTVSSSVVLEEGSAEGVSCVIRNPLLGQDRSTGLSIAGGFFGNTEPWMMFLALNVLLSLVVLLGLSFFLWRQCKVIHALSQKEREHKLRKKPPGQSRSGSKAPKGRCRMSSSQGGTLPRATLLRPRNVDGSPRAPGEDATPLLEQQGTAVSPSEDRKARVKQAAGGGACRGPGLPGAGAADPGASRDPDQAGAAASLHTQEQQYEQKYVLKDGCPEATNRIYFECGQEVPKRNLLRLAGLEQDDIVTCEHENPGSPTEQQHRMSGKRYKQAGCGGCLREWGAQSPQTRVSLFGNGWDTSQPACERQSSGRSQLSLG